MFPLFMSQYCFLKFCLSSFSRSFFVDICFRFLFEAKIAFSGKVLHSKLVTRTIIKRKEKRWGRFTICSLATGVLNTTIQVHTQEVQPQFSIDWFYNQHFTSHPKRTTIFLMVVDFQVYSWRASSWGMLPLPKKTCHHQKCFIFSGLRILLGCPRKLLNGW